MRNLISKKTSKIILLVISIILLIAIIIGAFFWNKYINKYTALKAFETPKSQQIYFLGTMHDDHFNKLLNYSIQDVQNVIENINPDIVFIESREKYFNEYNVIDGPIEMSIVYSYCSENSIKVELVDYWEVDEKYLSKNDEDNKAARDDKIFSNIIEKLNSVDNNSRVLIIYGRGHTDAQSNRFMGNGFREMKIHNIKEIFTNNSKFLYPKTVTDTWEKRAYFYAYTLPDIVQNTPGLPDEIKNQFIGGNKEAFYLQQMEYSKIFLANELFK